MPLTRHTSRGPVAFSKLDSRVWIGSPAFESKLRPLSMAASRSSWARSVRCCCSLRRRQGVSGWWRPSSLHLACCASWTASGAMGTRGSSKRRRRRQGSAEKSNRVAEATLDSRTKPSGIGKRLRHREAVESRDQLPLRPEFLAKTDGILMGRGSHRDCGHNSPYRKWLRSRVRARNGRADRPRKRRRRLGARPPRFPVRLRSGTKLPARMPRSARSRPRRQREPRSRGPG